jgi:hypothetical protein
VVRKECKEYSFKIMIWLCVFLVIIGEIMLKLYMLWHMPWTRRKWRKSIEALKEEDERW